jgi:hypothetical protein
MEELTPVNIGDKFRFSFQEFLEKHNFYYIAEYCISYNWGIILSFSYFVSDLPDS